MEQQLLILRFYLGYSPSEISHQLVLPVEQVYRLIYNALKKLADMLLSASYK
jgi:DNA-directed RNA polymerase specialized sigma24 family protein